MRNKEWDDFITETFKPQFEFIMTEITRLFELEKTMREERKESKKNLELIRIYLPEKEFFALEKGVSGFKKKPNLGGIPCTKSKREKISIDIEVVDPRKRKKKAIVYIKDSG